MRHCRQGNIITFLFGCNPSEEKASNFGRGVVTKLNGAFIVYRDLYKKYVYAFQREQFPPVEYRNATITLGENFVAILRWNWKSREHWSIRVLKNSFRAQFPSGSVLSRLRDNWIVSNRLKYFYGTTFNGVPFLFFAAYHLGNTCQQTTWKPDDTTTEILLLWICSMQHFPTIDYSARRDKD